MAALCAVAASLLRGSLCARALSTAADQLWATAIKYRSADKVLEVEFNTGECFTYPAEYLRAHSPAAEALDRQGRPKVVSGRRHVGLVDVQPVGSYAVRLEFDDLHRTGIYTWPYLHELGTHKLSRMRQYVRALKERGLSREPPRFRPRRLPAGGQRQAAAGGQQQGQQQGRSSAELAEKQQEQQQGQQQGPRRQQAQQQGSAGSSAAAGGNSAAAGGMPAGSSGG